MLDAMPDDAGSDTTITMALARFMAGPAPQAVPDSVRHVLQAALVDAVGCGLFGLTTPACRIVAGYAAEAGGRSESSLWCGAGLMSTTNAALTIGTVIHGFDFDDHHRSKIHPGATVIPATLALAEKHRASGATLLAVIAASYEVMARVSLAASPTPRALPAGI